MDPHKLRESEAMAARRSFSWARSWASESKKDLGGKPDFPGGSKLERPESGLAVNINELFPSGGRAALSSQSRSSAWGKESWGRGAESEAPCLGGFLRSSSWKPKDSCSVGKRGSLKTGSSSSWWKTESSLTLHVLFLGEGGSMSSSNFNFMAETISCQEDRAREKGESPGHGSTGGESEGSSPESSGSEMSDLGGVLDTMDASSSALFSSFHVSSSS